MKLFAAITVNFIVFAVMQGLYFVSWYGMAVQVHPLSPWRILAFLFLLQAGFNVLVLRWLSALQPRLLGYTLGELLLLYGLALFAYYR